MSRTADFNRDEVVEKAMHVFWSKGYENSSLKDLTEATGLLKGSIYNTFKSKENLFILCLEQYGRNSGSLHYKSGNPKVYLKNFFKRLINDGASVTYTKGCFVMNTCMELAGQSNTPALRAKTLFAATECNLKNVTGEIFKKSKSEGEIERVKNSLVTAAFSIREISKFKKDKKFLKQIANNALSEFNISI